MQNKYLGFMLLLFTLYTCKKETENDPKIQTLSIERVDNSHYRLKARVIETGTYEILDYGFDFGEALTTQGYNKTISLGTKPMADTFSTVITFTPNYSPANLHVRAYIKNTMGTAYGTDKSLQLFNSTMQITSFYPQSGSSGDTITFIGENINPSTSENTIWFGNKTATIISASETEINAIVPENLVLDYWDDNVQVYLEYQDYSYPVGYFTVLPSVADFSPKTGTFYDRIIITGNNLGSGSFTVLFGASEAYIESRDETHLTVLVPEALNQEICEISVTKNGFSKIFAEKFSLLPMVISSNLPLKGFKGISILIDGDYFNPNTYQNTVKIGSTNALVDWSGNKNQINFTVPDNLSVGIYTLIVSNGASIDTIDNGFTYVEPEITNITPSSAYLNDEITLTGTNFLIGANNPYLSFGNYGVGITSITDEEIKAKVPSYMPASEITIGLNYGSSNFTAPGTITVLPHYITDFSPASGTPGTLITINGQGFGDYYSTVKVLFGTIETNPASVTNNIVTVQVPSTIDAGSMKLTVKVNGIVAVTDSDFTILE